MQESKANCISVHQKFNRTISKHPLGNELDMVLRETERERIWVYVCVCNKG